MPESNQKTIRYVRERVLQYGPENLSDAELLGLVLGIEESTSAVLLAQCGSIRQLGSFGTSELCEVHSIGPHRAATLKALATLGARMATQPLERGKSYTNSRDIYLAHSPRMVALEHEEFWCLLLNCRNQLIKEVRVSVGTVKSCPLSTQEIFAPALREKAVRLVLLHNHPSGDPEPSSDDRVLTRRLVSISELMGLEIIDHLVVGDGRYVSFADRGWL